MEDTVEVAYRLLLAQKAGEEGQYVHHCLIKDEKAMEVSSHLFDHLWVYHPEVEIIIVQATVDFPVSYSDEDHLVALKVVANIVCKDTHLLREEAVINLVPRVVI